MEQACAGLRAASRVHRHCTVLNEELTKRPCCIPVPFRISGAIHWTLLPQNVKVRSPFARLLMWLQHHRPISVPSSSGHACRCMWRVKHHAEPSQWPPAACSCKPSTGKAMSSPLKVTICKLLTLKCGEDPPASSSCTSSADRAVLSPLGDRQQQNHSRTGCCARGGLLHSDVSQHHKGHRAQGQVHSLLATG